MQLVENRAKYPKLSSMSGLVTTVINIDGSLICIDYNIKTRDQKYMVNYFIRLLQLLRQVHESAANSAVQTPSHK